jgi:hypothetical protein
MHGTGTAVRSGMTRRRMRRTRRRRRRSDGGIEKLLKKRVMALGASISTSIKEFVFLLYFVFVVFGFLGYLVVEFVVSGFYGFWVVWFFWVSGFLVLLVPWLLAFLTLLKSLSRSSPEGRGSMGISETIRCFRMFFPRFSSLCVLILALRELMFLYIQMISSVSYYISIGSPNKSVSKKSIKSHILVNFEFSLHLSIIE